MGSIGLAVTTQPTHIAVTNDFQSLYMKHSQTVYRTALRVTGNPADAEDVLQTVFMRLFRQEQQTDPSFAAEAYLRRAATNASIDVIRRRSSQAETPLDLGRERAGPESTAFLKQRLREALSKIPPQDAELFCLKHLEGLSYEELAEQFGIERGTVASRLHRIRHTLQFEIAQ
jgi:RNA polymerase sigma-70 factor (ECF subfamily)